MSFDFVSTFAKDFGEKLKINKEIEKKEIDKKEMEIKKEIEKKENDLMEIDYKPEMVSVQLSRDIKSRDIKFDHSTDAMIVSGVNKGRRVEVRYVLPSNYEVEIGVNYDIDSSKRLEKGQIIDNCVVLAEIGINKYLTHCKKILFLDDNDITHIKDGIGGINSAVSLGV